MDSAALDNATLLEYVHEKLDQAANLPYSVGEDNPSPPLGYALFAIAGALVVQARLAFETNQRVHRQVEILEASEKRSQRLAELHEQQTAFITQQVARAGIHPAVVPPASASPIAAETDGLRAIERFELAHLLRQMRSEGTLERGDCEDIAHQLLERLDAIAVEPASGVE